MELRELLITLFHSTTIEISAEKEADRVINLLADQGYGNMVDPYTQHTFIFLTKQPQNLIKWSPFPDNCWVGVSVVDNSKIEMAGFSLFGLKAKVRFISFEPLLGDIRQDFKDYLGGEDGINWLIIGQQTPVSPKTQPKIEWVEEIVDAADRAGIPVFLKDNLRPLLHDPILRQEFPKAGN